MQLHYTCNFVEDLLSSKKVTQRRNFKMHRNGIKTVEMVKLVIYSRMNGFTRNIKM